MYSPDKTVGLDNPYYHLRNAEVAELAGDLDLAELAYKSAVMTSDSLPLAEYRKDFERELGKYKGAVANQQVQGVSLQQLTDAYSQLLGLPVHVRIRLGWLLYVQGRMKEAQQMCLEAMQIGLDPLIIEYPESKKLIAEEQKLQLALQRVGDDTERSQYMSISHVLRHRSLKKGDKETPECRTLKEVYSQLNVPALWADRKIGGSSRESGTYSMPAKQQELLTMDARMLVADLYTSAKLFVEELASIGRCKTQSFICTDPAMVQEYVQTTNVYGAPSTNVVSVLRCRISDRFWSLSIRAEQSCLELFVVATHELLNPSNSENESSIRARFRLRPFGKRTVWMSGGFPVYIDDVRNAVRAVLKEIVQKSEEFSGSHPSVTQSVIEFSGGSMARKVYELSQQKVNLAEKLVYQHESMQNRIARDIHDAVIADVLAVKRSFAAGGIRLTEMEIASSLDAIADRLRAICQDLSTRDLQDWGLQTVLRDVLTRVGDRCGAQSKFIEDGQLPNLPYEVQLHLYRIVQECLNNIEKYAKATLIEGKMLLQGEILSLSIEDNGVGFDPSQRNTRKASEGGMGLNTIRERVALIQCFYPAQVWIQSQIGSGTKITVEVNIGRKEPLRHV